MFEIKKFSETKSVRNKNKKKRQKRSKVSVAVQEEIGLMRQNANGAIMKKLELIEDLDQCSLAPSKSQILYFHNRSL